MKWNPGRPIGGMAGRDASAVRPAGAPGFRSRCIRATRCRHIANPEIQRGIAAYLEQIGLFLPFICTPEELLGEENVE